MLWKLGIYQWREVNDRFWEFIDMGTKGKRDMGQWKWEGTVI